MLAVWTDPVRQERSLEGPKPQPAATPVRRPSRGAFAWADASFSSDDSCGEDDGPAPPLCDDSYREGPLALLEDSRGGLNAQLRERAGVDSSGPLDFNFLVGQSPSRPSQPWEAAGYELCAATPPRSPWQPNLNAQEFVPPATLARIGQPQQAARAPGDATRATPARAGAARTPLATLNLDLLTPQKDYEQHPGSTPSSCAGESWRRRPWGARKRRPTTLQVPSQKRTKSEERETPAGAERRQRTAQAATSAAAASGAPSWGARERMPQPPEATEEEWQHRVEMRSKAVAVGKATAEYQRYKEMQRRGEEPDGDGLRTPDPTDRRMSKRFWKYTLQEWRVALKQRAPVGCLDVASSKAAARTKPADDVGLGIQHAVAAFLAGEEAEEDFVPPPARRAASCTPRTGA